MLFSYLYPPFVNRYSTGGNLLFLYKAIHLAVINFYVRKEERWALIRINAIFRGLIEKLASINGSHDHKMIRQLEDIKWQLIVGELYDSFKDEKFGSIFSLKHIPWNEKSKELIIRDMIRNVKLWKEKFKLGFEDLLSEEQSVYRELSNSDK